MTGEVLVVLYHRTADRAAITGAYHEVSTLMADTDGLLGNELLRSPHDPDQYLVISRWCSLAAFDTWEQGPGHKPCTAPLRPFRDHLAARPFGIYEVTAAYRREDDGPTARQASQRSDPRTTRVEEPR